MGGPLARVHAQRECVEVERECRVMGFAGQYPCWTDREGGALGRKVRVRAIWALNLTICVRRLCRDLNQFISSVERS